MPLESSRSSRKRAYCAGDLVGYGPHPNEVCALIDERDIPTIYGNYDYAIARDLDDCGCAYITPHDRELGQRSVEWTPAHTDQASKDFMRDLPFDLHVQVGDRPVHLVHGPRAKSTSTSSLTAAAIVAATVALSACGGSTSYPANVQTIFLTGCETTGSQTGCTCMLSYIEAHVSLADYSAGASAGATNNDYPQWLSDAITNCQ